MPNVPSQQEEGEPRPLAQRPGRLILGRYRVIATNDEGGFGTVNICWDKRLQRRVAIKEIPLRTDDGPAMTASTRDEALAEARTACLLGHPNIIQVFDFESDRNDSYIVMEYVDGLNLADLLSRVEGGTLTFDECAHVLESVSSALAFAHENGVLHLDIKPANIMIDRTGTVKLADFGMATLASAAGYGGARGGTIGYMPPEQIRGESVDERTDVFSLAVVVYQALTGVSPFESETAQGSIRKIERGLKPALSSVEPGLAGMVEDTLLRALDPDPTGRMASVKDFSDDIVAFLGNASEGRLSLRDLVSQAESDGVDPTDEKPPERVPLLERAPWLPSAACRISAGACAALVSRTIFLVLLPAASTVGAAAIGAATLAWPPLGSALVLLALVIELGSQASNMAFPLALLVGFIGTVWWLWVGSRDHLATTAILLPAALGSPYAGTFVAGYALSGTRALVTGSLSCAFGALIAYASAYGFDSSTLVRQALALARSPLPWASLVLAGVASLACSALSHRDDPKVRVTGQILCMLVLTIPPLVVNHMEKGSILEGHPMSGLAIAIMSCVVMCVVTVLVGPHGRDLEGEEDQ